MRTALNGFVVSFLCLPLMALANIGDDSSSISNKISSRYIQSISNRSEDVSKKIDQNTEKYLEALKKQEQVMQTDLAKIDVNAASRIFTGSTQEYEKIQNQLKNNSENILNNYGHYVPGIDSAITSLKFLQQGVLKNSRLGSQATQITSAMSKVTELENQFKKAGNVENFIQQRKAYLQQQLSSYNLGNSLQQYNKQAYYYSQQINDLKQSWNDPSRIEQKALTELNKLKSFQDFMKKNSLIAGLFNIPDDYGTGGITGLQTRDQVQQLMQEKMKLMGVNGGATAQQNIQDAQSTLTGLRDKINQTGSTGDLPNFQPNSQKTKSLFRRLEYGINFQNTRTNGLFPVSTSFAGTVAYKLNERSSFGVGLAYILGWGENIQHIHLSNQGIGIRSFLSTKIRGSFYATGGFEYNYMNVFSSISQINRQNLWQKSGLIGISKVLSMRGNFVKKTNVQLLWDFLSYYQLPKTQPFVFRLGYTF